MVPAGRSWRPESRRSEWGGRSLPPGLVALRSPRRAMLGTPRGRAVAPWSCLQGSDRRPVALHPSAVGRGGGGGAFRPLP